MLSCRAHCASPPLRAERSGASSREKPAAIRSRAEEGALWALPSIESRSSRGSAGAGPAGPAGTARTAGTCSAEELIQGKGRASCVTR